MDHLDALLKGTAFVPQLHEPATFSALLLHGRRIVERLGVRGQDADALVESVLSAMPVGPIDGSGEVTLEAAFRHRLNLSVLHWWRSERRRRAAGDRARAFASSSAREPDEPATRLAAEQDRDRVRRALERLPAREAQLLRQAYFTGMSTESLREQFGYASLNVLYVRLTQARAHLREFLSPSEPS